MPQRREHPYIWATCLPRLLTGENSCEWAVWFKANHQGWIRQPSDFDDSQRLIDHCALVNERIGNWTAGGYDVEIEICAFVAKSSSGLEVAQSRSRAVLTLPVEPCRARCW